VLGLLARLFRELGALDLLFELGEFVLAVFRVRMRFSTCSTEISLSIRPSTFSSRSVTTGVSRISCLSGIFTARCEATVSASLA
jgi:hypothetical protein